MVSGGSDHGWLNLDYTGDIWREAWRKRNTVTPLSGPDASLVGKAWFHCCTVLGRIMSNI